MESDHTQHSGHHVQAALKLLSSSALHAIGVVCPFGAGPGRFADVLHGAYVAAGGNKRAVRLRCRPEARTEAFGALRHLIDQKPPGPDFASALRQLGSHVAGLVQSNQQRVLVLIEDGEYLDAESAYVLTQLIQGGHVDLVLCASHSISKLENLEPLSALGHLPTLVISALNLAEIEAELSVAFGYRPTPGTTHAVYRATGGLLELIELLIELINIHELHHVTAGRLLLGIEELWDQDQMYRRVWETLRGLSAEALDTVVALALSGGVSRAKLTHLVPDNLTLEGLNGLLTQRADGTVELSSQWVIGAVRRLVSPSHARRLYAVWNEHLQFDNSYRWQPTWWALSVGETPAIQRVAKAAALANNEGDYQGALDLAKRSAGEQQDFYCELERLAAIAGLGRHVEAFHGLEHLSAHALTDAQLEALSERWIFLLTVGTATTGPRKHALENLRRIAGQDGERGWAALTLRIELLMALTQELSPHARAHAFTQILEANPPIDVLALAVVAGLEMMILPVFHPAVQDIEGRLSEITSLAVRQRLATVLFIRETMQGTCRDTSEETRSRFLEGAKDLGRMAAGLQGLERARALEHDGDLIGTVDGLAAAALDALAADAHQLACICVVSAFLRQPHLRGRHDWRDLSLRVEDILDTEPLIYREYARLGDLAIYRKQPSALREQLGHLRVQALPVMAVVGHWSVFCNFETLPTQEMANEIADLAKIEPVVGDGVPGAMAAIMFAAQQDAPHGIAQLKEQVHEQMAGLAVVACSAILLSKNASEDDRVWARRWLYTRSSWENAPVIVARALAEHGLSERELQTASLAAKGEGNRHIAAELNLSVRTVEGHLYRAFAKLGLGERSELAQFVGLRSAASGSRIATSK
ncbi:LuxR C-terminal-related transcriptional regulator [Glutamicibacter sp. PS]|uniref:helix-turn-helix transcriptional regulator n=1 Tax=Glutamicibacter sp. PS TaxID=3075634 RepID=UPI00283CF363|nr:LuxR C-terminal-related transcriptional regulator [Glutamicibacter sp. PS]MDR4533027.1 LuxR C-terminal-related transcriptional regulator [Glutamicibacter sp. PS]